MGQFLKHQLPDPQDYYAEQGLVFQGGGKQWRTTRCEFHGGSDSMRIHLRTGAFICMACCGARGGDVVAYHMAAHGMGFVEAAKALGAWRESPAKPGDKPHGAQRERRPNQPSARSIMGLVESELTLCAVLIHDALKGKLTEEEAARFRQAAGRIQFAAHFAGIQEEEFHDYD